MLIHAIFLLLILSMAACSGGMAQRTDELLGHDHQMMDDTELQVYYQQLSDQLARESRAIRTGERKASAAAEKESSGAEVHPLRQRWNVVRQELRRRDLLP